MVTGTATDDVGVAALQVAVRDQDTLLWLRADGTFGDPEYLDAVLDNPGADSTDWSFPVDLAEGNYAIRVRAEDTSGIRETSRPWVTFSVQSGTIDDVEPDSSVSAPENRETLTDTAVVVTGEATDNVGVAGVQVCLLYTSPSPRDATLSRMPSSA